MCPATPAGAFAPRVAISDTTTPPASNAPVTPSEITGSTLPNIPCQKILPPMYTSNIFAILGLRALYFALAAMVHRFAYLKYALALVLVFIGGKIFWHGMFGKVNPAISLGVTAALLAGGVIVSLVATRGAKAPAGAAE